MMDSINFHSRGAGVTFDEEGKVCILFASENLIKHPPYAFCYPDINEVDVKGDVKLKIIEGKVALEFARKACEKVDSTVTCNGV